MNMNSLFLLVAFYNQALQAVFASHRMTFTPRIIGKTVVLPSDFKVI